MPRLELIFLHSAIGVGCNDRRLWFYGTNRTFAGVASGPRLRRLLQGIDQGRTFELLIHAPRCARLVANAYLEAEAERLSDAISMGFARGRMRKPHMSLDGRSRLVDKIRDRFGMEAVEYGSVLGNSHSVPEGFRDLKRDELPWTQSRSL
jgi:hypothetical protein